MPLYMKAQELTLVAVLMLYANVVDAGGSLSWDHVPMPAQVCDIWLVHGTLQVISFPRYAANLCHI
jgi:hypothetical protein